MIQKVSSISLKLGTPTVYADLIFLYFQIAAEQTSYGFSRGDLPEIFPGFPGNSSNLGNLRGANCTRGATCPRGVTGPAALTRREEVAKRLPSLHRMMMMMLTHFFDATSPQGVAH